jgi:allophanate hydrolase
MELPDTLLIAPLLEGYRARRFLPPDVVRQVLAAIARAPDRGVWITLLESERILDYAAALMGRDPDTLPLYGVPFAIKDNIDLEGVPTTAGCPDYAYTPGRSAFVVRKLLEAGAIPIGKTNLDQFATGLVGTRSPYGAARNSFDPSYVSGGSSSGSAVAVAMGLVSFALGTDTAGSGRVPAGFNNIVGLKPTCGAVSSSGVVPACRSLDCVSIFALTADDAARVYDVVAEFDPDDCYSRAMSGPRARAAELVAPREPSPHGIATWQSAASPFRFGVPRSGQLEFFGDDAYARLFDESVRRLGALGGTPVEIDFEPFLAAARLLYEGPWVVERYCAVGEFLERQPQSVHPVTRQIILKGRESKAVDAFRSQYRLMELRRATEQTWSRIDVLMTPTSGTIYRIDAVESDPIRLNSNLGYYTNFVNLLDLAAVAVPAGFRADGLPFGVTLVGRAGADRHLLTLADGLHRSRPTMLGALAVALPPNAPAATRASPGTHAPGNTYPAEGADAVETIAVAVCGAHMEGLPLNHQLTSRGAVFLTRTRTAPAYRFYALPGGPPHRPGLVRVTSGGASIEVEIWAVPAAHFGTFVAGIPAPLGIGKVELETGEHVAGFVCESYAIATATDITCLASWRRYLG